MSRRCCVADSPLANKREDCQGATGKDNYGRQTGREGRESREHAGRGTSERIHELRYYPCYPRRFCFYPFRFRAARGTRPIARRDGGAGRDSATARAIGARPLRCTSYILGPLGRSISPVALNRSDAASRICRLAVIRDSPR